MSSPATWVPLGATIVSWRWVTTADKHAPPRRFSTYEDAEAYAIEAGVHVVIEYDLQAPDGRALSRTPYPPKMALEGDALVGSIVVERRYQISAGLQHPGPSWPTPEEAQVAAEDTGMRWLEERLTLRTPDGETFEVRGRMVFGTHVVR